MDIAAFLAARLDEDEAAARAATEGRWRTGTHVGRTLYGHSTPGVAKSGDLIGVMDTIADAAHITRHDPARVLADVAAKRALMDLHSYQCCVREHEGYTVIEWYDSRTDPYPSLRALAAPYANHPDHNPAWRIEP